MATKVISSTLAPTPKKKQLLLSVHQNFCYTVGNTESLQVEYTGKGQLKEAHCIGLDVKPITLKAT